MDLQYFLCWRAALLFLWMPCQLYCTSVSMNQKLLHVIPGSDLLLEAEIEQGQEAVDVSWEREAESGMAPVRVTLATCPDTSPQCNGTRPNIRAYKRHKVMTLQINDYSGADSGVYTVTVTDRSGVKTAAQCIVREYVAIHHVTVSINDSHSTLVCIEAWGTDPKFSWMYERSAIPPSVGEISKDGTALVLFKSPICGHFTCMVRNKLSHSSATYTAGPCDVEERGTTAAVVCLVFLLLVGGGMLVFLLWRRHGLNNRGERLHEHLDDTI